MRNYLTLAVTVILAVALGCGSTRTKQVSKDQKQEATSSAQQQQISQETRQQEATEASGASPAPSYDAVSLQKGQTLSSLAREYDISVEQILAANDHIKDPKSIPVGKPIFIPTGQTSAEQASQKAEMDTGSSGGGAEAGAEKPASDETVEPKDLSPSDLHRGQADARFWWPTNGEVVRKFGNIFRSSKNPGLGIAAPAGQEVCAIADGTVQVSRDTSSNGDRQWEHVVVIKHDNNFESWYGLLSSTTVEKNQKVEQGQRIGLVSPRGIDGQPQLEFRLYQNGQKVDPTEYLP